MGFGVKVRGALRPVFWYMARTVLPAWWFARVQGWRFRRQVAGYSRRVVTHRYGSGSLTVELRDPIGASWYDTDWAEPSEFALLRLGQLRPGANVFDIGGHQGVIGLMLAREVAPDGQVVVVEPSPHNFEAAQRNHELNPEFPVRLVHAAIGAEPGLLRFEEGFNPSVSHPASSRRSTFEIRAVSVDQLAREYGAPDVLFIDVEGYECRVLKGATEVLRARPTCFVEVHIGHGLEQFGSVEEVLSFFPNECYDILIKCWTAQEFKPFLPGDPVVTSMFLLVALARQTGVRGVPESHRPGEP